MHAVAWRNTDNYNHLPTTNHLPLAATSVYVFSLKTFPVAGQEVIPLNLCQTMVKNDCSIHPYGKQDEHAADFDQ